MTDRQIDRMCMNQIRSAMIYAYSLLPSSKKDSSKWKNSRTREQAYKLQRAWDELFRGSIYNATHGVKNG